MNEIGARTFAGPLTGLFVATWVVLGITGFIFFFLNRDAALKRKWFPRYITLAGVLFVLYVTAMTVAGSPSFPSLGVLVLVVPMVVLISYLNLKFTKFCNQCGATIIEQNWFSPTRFCSKCGNKLDSGKANQLDEL
jgi:hypothetical protein